MPSTLNRAFKKVTEWLWKQPMLRSWPRITTKNDIKNRIKITE